MKKDLFALKGTICYSKNQKELVFHENSYVVCENSLCAGIFSQLPAEYKDIPVEDMGDRSSQDSLTFICTLPSTLTAEPAWIWSCWTG